MNKYIETPALEFLTSPSGNVRSSYAATKSPPTRLMTLPYQKIEMD
jgi:hypothetical protein